MITYNHPQGGDAWLQCRVGKITASRAKDARDCLKSGKPSTKQISYAAQVALERIAGKPIDRTFESWQMREGKEQEPICRQEYEIETGLTVSEVGAIATDDERFLYSPDGLIGADGLLEVKSLFSADRIVQIIGNDDHSDFIDQCNFGLWLTGREWIDLAIWSPALAPIGAALHIIRITRDDDEIEKLEADLMKFAVLVDEFETKLRLKAA